MVYFYHRLPTKDDQISYGGMLKGHFFICSKKVFKVLIEKRNILFVSGMDVTYSFST